MPKINNCVTRSFGPYNAEKMADLISSRITDGMKPYTFLFDMFTIVEELRIDKKTPVYADPDEFIEFSRCFFSKPDQYVEFLESKRNDFRFNHFWQMDRINEIDSSR